MATRAAPRRVASPCQLPPPGDATLPRHRRRRMRMSLTPAPNPKGTCYMASGASHVTACAVRSMGLREIHGPEKSRGSEGPTDLRKPRGSEGSMDPRDPWIRWTQGAPRNPRGSEGSMGPRDPQGSKGSMDTRDPWTQ